LPDEWPTFKDVLRALSVRAKVTVVEELVALFVDFLAMVNLHWPQLVSEAKASGALSIT